jgi:hypothetical protein
MIRKSIALFVVTALVTLPAPAFGQCRRSESVALKQFRTAVEGYDALRQRLEQQLPPRRLTENAEELLQSSGALARAIRAARATAREGDIFAPAVAAEIRQRIAEALAANGYAPGEVIAASREEAAEDAEWPVVNGTFPWARGAAMWPCILNALPSLPDEIQYRFVEGDLVLVDEHADLVIDILRDAIR